MQQRDDRLLFSPSDLGNFLACEHLTQLDLTLALQGGRRPSYENAYAELLRTKGEEHEKDDATDLVGDARIGWSPSISLDAAPHLRVRRGSVLLAERIPRDASLDQ